MKKYFTIVLIGLTIFSGGLIAQELPVDAQTDTIFFDDFSGNSLDREKWNVVGTDFWVNNEQQVYVDSAATIFNVKGADAKGVENALVLKAHYSPDFINYRGNDFDFISGRINTRDKVMFTTALPLPG